MDWSKCLVSGCSFVTIYWKVVLFIYLFVCLLLPSVDLLFYFELCDVIAATCSLNNDLEFLLDLVWCWLKIDLILVGFWHTAWCDLASAEMLVWLKMCSMNVNTRECATHKCKFGEEMSSCCCGVTKCS